MTDQPKTPREAEKQRVDRELVELLNELRVALPGVQVLFAFKERMLRDSNVLLIVGSAFTALG